MEVILLEKVARLGNVGDVVNVKTGYGRNFLIPFKKAVRATKESIAKFEAQREALVQRNDAARVDAQELAKAFEGMSVKIVRQAAEDGRLYGSVSARDVVEAIAAAGRTIERRQVDLADGIKSLGLFKAYVSLHPEVRVTIDVQVVRNAEMSAYDLVAKEAASEDAAA